MPKDRLPICNVQVSDARLLEDPLDDVIQRRFPVHLHRASWVPGHPLGNCHGLYALPRCPEFTGPLQGKPGTYGADQLIDDRCSEYDIENDGAGLSENGVVHERQGESNGHACLRDQSWPYPANDRCWSTHEAGAERGPTDFAHQPRTEVLFSRPDRRMPMFQHSVSFMSLIALGAVGFAAPAMVVAQPTTEVETELRDALDQYSTALESLDVEDTDLRKQPPI